MYFLRLSLWATAVSAVPLLFPASPKVTLPYGTVLGATSNGIESFKGVPYAQPPVGDLRLRPPKPINGSLGEIVATASSARACPQFQTQIATDDLIANILATVFNLPIFSNAGEDCLTVDVVRPAGTTADSKLPVVFWIYGGGFEFGSTSAEDGAKLVQKSVALDAPMVYVAVNYRVGGFGFMAGEELANEGSTNLGLKDQRLGLQWTQDNIAAFGGDPTRVTIWGESAGSISCFDHMIINGGDNTYKGKPLFQGAMMSSGTVIPADEVTSPKAQGVYDAVVSAAGCADATDTLACLRAAPYSRFLAATRSVPGIIGYRGLDLSYLPRPDPNDDFFPLSPEIPMESGAIARVPYIVGAQEDEGTILAFLQNNITTQADLHEYLTSYFPSNPNAAQTVADLLDHYPNDPSAGQPYGSPFNTNSSNNIFPQYKRLAAVTGDLLSTLRRRHFLETVTAQAPDIPRWSSIASYLYGTGVLGTYHGSDVPYAYGTAGLSADDQRITAAVQTYYISFVNHLDPSVIGVARGTTMEWPQWQPGGGMTLLNFLAADNALMEDTFRPGAYEFIKANEGLLRV